MNKALLPRITELFELLRNDSGYLFDDFLSEEDKQAATDLFEHETLICPAAWKLLRGFETLHPLDKASLEEPILFGTRLLAIAGATVDSETTREIGHLEHVLRYARNLEELRQTCLRCMNEP